MFNNAFTLICSFLIFSISMLNAQKDLVTGYVITESGEKLDGYFNSNELDVYSRLVAFSTDKNFKDFTVYQADMLQEIKLEDRFVYHSFPIDFTFYGKTGREFRYKGTRNLRLVQGNSQLALYELTDLDMRAWFIKKEGKPLQFLSVNKKLNTNAVNMIKEVIADCGCISFDDTMPVKINHVSELFDEYNTFLDSPIVNMNATAVHETTSMSQED